MEKQIVLKARYSSTVHGGGKRRVEGMVQPDDRQGENKMWNAYVAASALLYAILAVMHLVRIINRWSVVIGPNNISMNVSWVALVVSALLSIRGFAQLA